MEQHPFTGFPGSIQAVTDNGTAQAQGMGGMKPELMGAAGQRDKFHPGLSIFH